MVLFEERFRPLQRQKLEIVFEFADEDLLPILALEADEAPRLHPGVVVAVHRVTQAFVVREPFFEFLDRDREGMGHWRGPDFETTERTSMPIAACSRCVEQRIPP
jgi:hypothetical protein